VNYSELIQVNAGPGTKAAVAQAARLRGIKSADWLRNAISTSLAMDAVLQNAQDAS
jgi:hypothetical protein